MERFVGSSLYNVEVGVVKHRNVIRERDTGDVTQFSISYCSINSAGTGIHIFEGAGFSLILFLLYNDLKYAILQTISS